MEPTDLPGRPCSIAQALNAVGEKWALLAIREISLGNHRFDQIARNTGAPRDRLAARLRGLEAVGVVERVAYSERPVRHEYRLTTAGRDLIPAIQALRAWGDRWIGGVPPMTFTHRTPDGDHPLEPVLVCRDCGQEFGPSEVRVHTHTPGWTRTGPS